MSIDGMLGTGVRLEDVDQGTGCWSKSKERYRRRGSVNGRKKGGGEGRR